MNSHCVSSVASVSNVICANSVATALRVNILGWCGQIFRRETKRKRKAEPAYERDQWRSQLRRVPQAAGSIAHKAAAT